MRSAGEKDIMLKVLYTSRKFVFPWKYELWLLRVYAIIANLIFKGLHSHCASHTAFHIAVKGVTSSSIQPQYKQDPSYKCDN